MASSHVSLYESGCGLRNGDGDTAGSPRLAARTRMPSCRSSGSVEPLPTSSPPKRPLAPSSIVLQELQRSWRYLVLVIGRRSDNRRGVAVVKVFRPSVATKIRGLGNRGCMTVNKLLPSYTASAGSLTASWISDRPSGDVVRLLYSTIAITVVTGEACGCSSDAGSACQKPTANGWAVPHGDQRGSVTSTGSRQRRRSMWMTSERRGREELSVFLKRDACPLSLFRIEGLTSRIALLPPAAFPFRPWWR